MARPSNEMLSRVPLFSGLEKRDLERIADSFKQRDYSAGDTIASEGSGRRRVLRDRRRHREGLRAR